MCTSFSPQQKATRKKSKEFAVNSGKIIQHPKFGAYYKKNWDACKEMWAEFALREKVNYGYLTTISWSRPTRK